ncbi:hypothetical protein MRS76_22985 [Rhizobiaceae bacterium n13]|uniref:Uncharacterized protein n=1 Tax=Ferirhizobium litorale TaxID=2927786 RepID=A0AAE3QDS9_9HYPH|nr:hypothetical protein [Fererhizobium litorale]MDI7864798.1 hypothetical protein [Fererhizobium litorale]MDI7921710.1 hypothetical protein [Fererhizobium litorale]
MAVAMAVFLATSALAQTAEPELYEGETLKPVTMPASGPLVLEGWTRSGKATVYTLAVKKGQSYALNFTPSSAYAYLVVFDLSKPEDEAMYSSDINGKQAVLKADSDTTWLIRPYFSRVASRRGLGAHYRIEIMAR